MMKEQSNKECVMSHGAATRLLIVLITKRREMKLGHFV